MVRLFQTAQSQILLMLAPGMLMFRACGCVTSGRCH
jgi:hypothetical protein